MSKAPCSNIQHRGHSSTSETVPFGKIGNIETRLGEVNIALNLEVATATALEGSTGQPQAINASPKIIKKITCLGSGFVGGMMSCYEF